MTMEKSAGLVGKSSYELAKMLALNSPDKLLPVTTGNSYAIGQHPMSFRIWATVIHLVIFLFGVVGNIILVVVVRKTKSLRTSTYCYLVSLAVADLMVLLSAVPEAVVSHHIGWRWVTGQLGCSVMVFSNFLGINAGSLSILAFTVDRYIAACRPLLILRVCNWKYARKVVAGIWLFALLYCAPWLGLTQVKPDEDIPEHEICHFRVSVEVVKYWFITDLILFYVFPLFIAAVIYIRLGLILRRSIKSFRDTAREYAAAQKNQSPDDSVVIYNSVRKNTERTMLKMEMSEMPKSQLNGNGLQQQQQQDILPSEDTWMEPPISPKARSKKLKRSRTRVFRMLVIIVVLFAVTWLPYRGLLVYNYSLASEQWSNLLYMFFAKTCIYFNCAINPYLYNVFSRRFRIGMWTTLTCQSMKE